MKRPRRSSQFSQVGRRIRAFKQGACIAAFSVFLAGPYATYSQTVSALDKAPLNNHPSAEEVKPHFVDLLADFERKLEQQAQQAELLVEAQQLREEGEALLQSGETETASFKFDAALELLETAVKQDPSGIPIREFQYQLKDKLQEVLLGTPDNSKFSDDRFILPRTLNEEVRHFIRYFQGPGKKNFEKSSKRSIVYRDMMERVFKEEGLPTELVFLAQIESGFDPLALSSASARSLWQFVPETARRYGLRQTEAGDERADPLRSTRAAARYLKDLYTQFKNWPLALAAYNAGEKRIADLIAKTGIQDFWTLSRSKLLPKETMAYVPAVLASILLHRPEATRAASKRAYSADEALYGSSCYPKLQGKLLTELQYTKGGTL